MKTNDHRRLDRIEQQLHVSARGAASYKKTVAADGSVTIMRDGRPVAIMTPEEAEATRPKEKTEGS